MDPFMPCEIPLREAMKQIMDNSRCLPTVMMAVFFSKLISFDFRKSKHCSATGEKPFGKRLLCLFLTKPQKINHELQNTGNRLTAYSLGISAKFPDMSGKLAVMSND
ncbi:MAG: hypothetical protein LBU34_07700 [Planctomycetaceae bacterium]|nr:hypothetical protein [Planctomycetaceae bacterium]